jgi:hypothetical protein
MSAALVRSLLETALAAVAPPIDTEWENTIYTPVSGVPYQRANLLLTDPQNPSITGTNFQALTRELGIFQVTLRYPLGAGNGAAGVQAERLRAAFPMGQTFQSGLTTVIVSRTPTISSGRIDGDRWSVPVKISFFANCFG